MKRITKNIGFVLASTIAMVFFSEKAYWYVQGYAYLELILYYALVVSVCLWVIEFFRIRDLPGLVLVAALYGFLVEGILTSVLYEGGLLDPFLPAYFIGWHGFLGLFLGWYLIRKYLVSGNWRRLLVFSSIFGIFWGLWSVTYWLPQTFEDFRYPGRWPVLDYGFYAFTFTLTLIAVHWLFGRSVWPDQFHPTKLGKWAVGLMLAFIFAFTVIPVVPLGFLKLGVLVGGILLLLNRSRKRISEETSFVGELAGPICNSHLLTMLTMPIISTIVYWGITILDPGEEFLIFLLEGFPTLQALFGLIWFLWAIISILRSQSSLGDG